MGLLMKEDKIDFMENGCNGSHDDEAAAIQKYLLAACQGGVTIDKVVQDLATKRDASDFEAIRKFGAGTDGERLKYVIGALKKTHENGRRRRLLAGAHPVMKRLFWETCEA